MTNFTCQIADSLWSSWCHLVEYRTVEGNVLEKAFNNLILNLFDLVNIFSLKKVRQRHVHYCTAVRDIVYYCAAVEAILPFCRGNAGGLF